MSVGRVLLARTGAEAFAFPLADILEAVEAPPVEPLALAPHGVAGQCVHRGRLVPVLDGGLLLGSPRTDGRGVLLMLEADGGRAALWMDDVLDMVPVEGRHRRPVPTALGVATTLLEEVLDLDGTIAGLVAMEALRAAMAARLTTGVA